MFSHSIHRQLVSMGRAFSTTRAANADYTHAVVGGGVVGLAIARKLAAREGTSTVLIERHGAVGTETSSRNSEVIHAGIFYGTDSLKTEVCVKGKQMLYELCDKQAIPYRRTKKWLVAQEEEELNYLGKVHEFAKTIGVPTEFISLEEAKKQEPHVNANSGILESPTTGIVDSHSLMTFLLGDFEERGGDTALHSSVTRIEPIDNGKGGYRIFVAAEDGSEDPITAETLINSAGHGACAINNMVLPNDRHRQPFYAKGTYFSYSASHPKVNTLVYPAPRPGHGGLGTHLTLDMAGRIRFGPDVEWVDNPDDLTPNPSRLADGLKEIKKYLPGVHEDAIDLDYCGIRPKLARLASNATGKGFQDFYVRSEDGFPGFINLLGIESPGLTSSLAIGDKVDSLLYR